MWEAVYLSFGRYYVNKIVVFDSQRENIVNANSKIEVNWRKCDYIFNANSLNHTDFEVKPAVIEK